MDDSDSEPQRRRVLQYTASLSLAGLAGCLGGGTGEEPTPEPTEPAPLDLPADKENCVSHDGIERDPNDLISKEAAQYQRSPNYRGESGYIEMCANCRYFCPVTSNGENGGCSEVAGGILSQHWCGLWQPTERLSNLNRSSASRWAWDRTDLERIEDQ